MTLSCSKIHLKNFDFCACPSKNGIKRDASGNKAIVANAFLSIFELI